ncbi:LacI family DNA-binding transcriptional regulator [Spirochaeta lutea]|uniref:HTH lacI-type domain-containing protein n=1 Tax=Spirochaeta lutea TaxID=1480694 RepID=A0A098QW54_9SPIO|nr:LacI family DNA-binding transcriptional regulator [Spirochaeta lutea]KGE72085.1 hypothetical protein DC28_08270 [Spirochaeta lutea]
MKETTVTVKDIARIAQVSIGTVDRVIHNRGRVSDTTRARIQKIIEETGYSPNLQASRLSKAKTWTVAAVFPRTDQDSGFWEESARGLARANEDYAGLGLRSIHLPFDRTEPRDFHRAVEEALAGGSDALLLAPVLTDPAREALAAVPPEMPLILFDTPLPGSGAETFVGQDAHAAGKLGARLLCLAAKSARQLAAVAISPGDHHIDQRIQGFRSFLETETAGAISQVFQLHNPDNPDAIDEVLANIESALPEVSGLYVANSAVGRVARRAALRGLDWLIIGHDMTPGNLEALQEGQISFLISQHPSLQTFEAMRLLWKHFAMKTKLPDTLSMPIDIISPENWSYYREI